MTRLGNFLPIGLLLEAHYDFLKRWATKKWQHFGLLFAQANILYFCANKQSQKHGLLQVY